MSHPTLRLPRPSAAGFTLIELLAVMLIIGILAMFLVPQIPKAMDRANVTACRSNLSKIGEGLLAYETQFKDMPTTSGARFHTALIFDKVWESTSTNAQRLTCPNVRQSSLTIGDFDEEEWYIDEDAIDGSYTAYAGRNMKDYPLRHRTASGFEALVADDNYPDGNHRTTTLALMGDYSVREYELVDLQKKGLVDEEEEFLRVGAESPIEALQKLSQD